MMRVWHNDRTFSADRDKPALFPDHFTHVATVDHDEPGAAFEWTNSIHKGWWENAGVTVTPVVSARGGARSTSVGDIIEMADGTLLLVKGIGFGEVTDKIVDWRDTF